MWHVCVRSSVSTAASHAGHTFVTWIWEWRQHKQGLLWSLLPLRNLKYVGVWTPVYVLRVTSWCAEHCAVGTRSVFIIMVIIIIIFFLQTLINEALAAHQQRIYGPVPSVSLHAAINRAVVNSLLKEMLAMVTPRQRLRSRDDEILWNSHFLQRMTISSFVGTCACVCEGHSKNSNPNRYANQALTVSAVLSLCCDIHPQWKHK